jgi:hypothetical protein
VANTCNLSSSGGRDKETHGTKPAQANCLQELILEKKITKKELVEWLNVKALSSSPGIAKKKKKKKRKRKKIP